MASIEITMRHSDVRIEALKEYAQQRMEKLCESFPKVTKVTCVIDIDVKKHMYMAEVVANRLGTTAVGAKEFSESAKSVIDTAAARAERQLLKMRVKARKGNVRETLSVVDRAYLVYNGRLLKEGTSNELVNDPEVRAKYLGEGFRM